MMWTGSVLGCWLSRAVRWHAAITKLDGAAAFSTRTGKSTSTIAIGEIRDVELEVGWFWSKVHIRTADAVFTLPGASKEIASNLASRLDAMVLASLRQRLDKLEPLILRNSERVEAFLAQDRYLRHSDVVAFQGALRHGSDLTGILLEVLHHPYAGRLQLSISLRDHAKRIDGSIRPGSDVIKQRNEEFIRRELEAQSSFFDLVEKTPLTEEQRRAAIIFEDRNLLVAAAGSGKSSTLIGKAGYAIRRGLYQPSEIVALAFNRKAAAELNERVRSRLGDALKGKRLRANTFHALGSMIVHNVAKQSGTRLRIAKESSEKPRMEKVLERLCTDNAFMSAWVQLVSLCREPLLDDDAFQSYADYESHIEWKRRARKSGEAADFQPLTGAPVRSGEELAIANWLYLNSIPFEYEKRFEPFPADWDKYEPDFYFPDIDVWYEHFGLNTRGEAPSFFKPGYAQQAVKKRRWLDQHVPGKWFETRSHQYRNGALFQELERALKGYGQVFRPKSPEEVLARVKSLRQTDVLDLLLKVFHLVKSNGYDKEEVARRAATMGDHHRVRSFLRVFWPLYDGYNAQLALERAIDFNDMILRAAEHVERGEYLSPYKLVMVDEFQDMSLGRARLVRALLAQHKDSVLFGVGDDWQAINGFAGSDLRLFMEFEKAFGVSSESLLSKTFRCPQGISDVAAAFIQKNKNGQKSKSVVSELDKRLDSVIDLCDVKKDAELAGAIEAQLSSLMVDLAAQAGGKQPVKKVSVYLLSRYKIENTPGINSTWLRRIQARYAELMSIDFLTVHKSKGLEADFVFLLGLNGGKSKAFPSAAKNDPLVDMMLSADDSFPFAEERRLFYVALTRAKRKCIVFFRQLGASPFVLELMTPEYSKSITYRAGPLARRCSSCREGFLVLRPSKYGKPFLGCTRYSPDGGCRHQEPA